MQAIEARTHRKLTGLDADGPHYTVVSPHLRDEIAPFGVKEATYVPNGVFAPGEETFAPIRADHGIPEDATVVFNVGSLTTQKRPVRFAELLRAVTDDHEDIHVVMAGDGPLRDDVEAHASDQVHVLGYVSDEAKWRWFADADVFASLSAYEGMPVASAEALSFDLPLVLSDIPSHRHLLDTYDATGRLVGDDADGIATAVAALRGRRSNATLPTWREVAGRYLDLVMG
jgi:glycosyltransferase involved in cell wall biosynthesis